MAARDRVARPSLAGHRPESAPADPGCRVRERIRDDEKELPENTAASYEIPEQPTLDDSNIGSRDKKPQTEAPLVPSLVPVEATPLPPPPSPAPVAAPVPVAAARPQVGIFVRMWRFLFGSPTAPCRERIVCDSGAGAARAPGTS